MFSNLRVGCCRANVRVMWLFSSEARLARKAKREGKKREKQLESDIKFLARANTVEGLNTFLQTTFLVSSLLVGVSLTLLTLLSWEQLERVQERWAKEVTLLVIPNTVGDSPAEKAEYVRWLNDFMYDSAVFLAYTGVICSGAQFAVAMMVYFSLTTHDIHPEDYTSATKFEHAFKPLLNAMHVLGLLSFTSISLGAGSCINLYFQPTVYGQVTARVGYILPPALVVFGVIARVKHVSVTRSLETDRFAEDERRNTEVLLESARKLAATRSRANPTGALSTDA